MTLKSSLQAIVVELRRRQEEGESTISIDAQTLEHLKNQVAKARPRVALQVLFDAAHTQLVEKILSTAGLTWSTQPGNCVLCLGAKFAGQCLPKQCVQLNQPLTLDGITYIPTIDVGLLAEGKDRKAKRVLWEGVLATMHVLKATPTATQQSLFL